MRRRRSAPVPTEGQPTELRSKLESELWYLIHTELDRPEQGPDFTPRDYSRYCAAVTAIRDLAVAIETLERVDR